MTLGPHYCMQIDIDQAITQVVLQTRANKPAENSKYNSIQTVYS